MVREQREGRSEIISHIAGPQVRISGSHPGQVVRGCGVVVKEKL